MKTISIKAQDELNDAFRDIAWQLKYTNFSRFVRDSIVIGSLCLASENGLSLNDIPQTLISEDVIINPHFNGKSQVFQALYSYLDIDDVMSTYNPGTTINIVGFTEEQLNYLTKVAKSYNFNDVQEYLDSDNFKALMQSCIDDLCNSADKIE